MKKLFVRLVKNESGVTAIEYGLIAGLISVLIIAGVTTIGTNLQDVFDAIATALTPAA
jgi:pilus assembly protein Flp/PilA